MVEEKQMEQNKTEEKENTQAAVSISLKSRILRKLKLILATLWPLTIKRFNRGMEETQKLLKKGFKDTQKQITSLKNDNQKRFSSLKTEMQKQTTTLKAEMQKLKTEEQKQTTTLKTEMQKQTTALKSEMQKQVTALKAEEQKQTTALKTEMQKQITALKNEIQRLTKEGEEQRKQNKELQKMLLSSQQILLSYYESLVSDQQTLLERYSMEEEVLANISRDVKDHEQVLDAINTVKLGVENSNVAAMDAIKEVKLDVGNSNVATMEAVKEVKLGVENSTRAAMEGVWADVFNNTINNSSWLLDQTFSPGRWAVGYQCLYAMYRILDEAKPKRILELGLGQSTRMISQYAATHEGVEHVVVENDASWVEFFKNAYDMPECSRIEVCEHEMVSYNEADEVRVYKDFAEKLKGMQFDFIVIDAPKSGDMKRYARIDVLRMMPDCLSENFVILMDDYNRATEIRTVREMEKVLKENAIAYKRGKYSGLKDCGILCAEHLGFLATL